MLLKITDEWTFRHETIMLNLLKIPKVGSLMQQAAQVSLSAGGLAGMLGE